MTTPDLRHAGAYTPPHYTAMGVWPPGTWRITWRDERRPLGSA